MTGAEVRDARTRLGWSLSRLAEALGVHRMTVHAWESGRQQPPPYLALALRYLAERPTRSA